MASPTFFGVKTGANNRAIFCHGVKMAVAGNVSILRYGDDTPCGLYLAAHRNPIRRYTMAPEHSPLAYRVPDACRAAGIGKTSLYALAAAGKLRLVRVAGRTLVPADDLRALIASAPQAKQAN